MLVLAIILFIGSQDAQKVALASQDEGDGEESEEVDIPRKPRRWEVAVEPQIPETTELVEHGKEIYSQVCYVCHGSEGKGNGQIAKFMVTDPRDFTSGLFKVRTTLSGELPTDLDIFRTITTGFPEYGMPSFYLLKPEERWGLVYYVKKFYPYFEEDGPGEVVTIGEATPKTDEAIASGKEMYVTLGCVSCHGKNGQGDGPSVSGLEDDWGNPIYPPDFSLGKRVLKGGDSSRDIVRALMTGRNGTPMPSYKDVFEALEVSPWPLAYFIEELTEGGLVEEDSQ